MASILKVIPIEKLIPLSFLLILIPAGIAGWLIGYPASTGYVNYEGDRPVGYDLADAEQALVNHGYSVEVNPSEYATDPHLIVTVDSGSEGSTVAWLTIPDQGQTIEIHAHRQISVAPYEVTQDLHELGREQRVVVQEDMRDILSAAALPDTGTFIPFDDIDSFDYFLPTTVFYVLLFIHLPLTILMALLAVLLKVKENPFSPHVEPYRR